MPAGQLGNAMRHIRRLLGSPGGDDTDRDLLRRYSADRDEEAFRLLVRRHGPMVLGVCRRVLGHDSDADDAFQVTFLVLARKAGTGFWRESVGSWLYGVAYRTAQKVRTRAARRSRHEQGAAALQPTTVTENPEARELRQVLDAELQRMPENYRMPLLLCCLQDQTVDEAAQHLGWSFATVKGRLQRGREMLRDRLQRRGIELSAGVLAAVVTQGVVSATPPALASATIQSVITGTIAAPAGAILKGVLRAMFWTNVKHCGLVLLLFGLMGAGVGIPAYSAWAGKETVAALAPNPEAQELPAHARGQRTLVGFAFHEDRRRGDRQPVAEEIRAALKKANLDLLEVVNEEERSKPSWIYNAMLLLGGAGATPEKTLASLPHFSGAIVFQEGLYQEGLPHDNPAPWLEKGKVPAAYGWRRYGNGSMGRGQMYRDLPSLRAIPGVQVQFWPEDSSGGSVGWVKLTPENGKLTLLEVFLKTKADFHFVDAAAALKEARPSEPVEKNGLSVTVTPALAGFSHKEPIAFTVTFKNTSDKSFMLFESGYFWDWTIRFGDWQLFRLAEAKRAYPPSLLLEPGKSVETVVTLDNNMDQHFRFDWTGLQAAKPVPERFLPVGKYPLVVEVKLREDIRAERLKDYKFPRWTGEITTKPVPIEIGAAKK